MKKRNQTRRGSTLVEMALIGTIFFILLIAAADFGQFLFLQEALVQRAQAAARWGSAHGATDSTAIQNMVLYGQSSAPPKGNASFGLMPSMVSVSTADAGTDNYRLIVQISGYSQRLLSPYLAGFYRGPPITVSVPLGLYYR